MLPLDGNISHDISFIRPERHMFAIVVCCFSSLKRVHSLSSCLFVSMQVGRLIVVPHDESPDSAFHTPRILSVSFSQAQHLAPTDPAPPAGVIIRSFLTFFDSGFKDLE